MGTSPGLVRLASSAPRSLFETAFDAVPGPALVFDARQPSLSVVLANAAARAAFLLDSPDHALIESSLYSLLGPQGAVILRAELDRAESAAPLAARLLLEWRMASGLRSVSTVLNELDGGPGQRLVMLALNPPEFAPPAGELPRMGHLLGEVLQAARMGGWEYDLRSRALLLSAEAHRLLPSDPARSASERWSLHALCAPGSRRRLLQAYRRALVGDGRLDLEIAVRVFPQRLLWVRLIGRIIRQDGRPVCVTGSVQDIQTRREKRVAFANARRWLRLSMAMAHMRAWRWDRATDALTFAVLERSAARSTRPHPTGTAMRARVHPKDRAAIEAAIERAFLEHRQVYAEFRFKMHNGRYRWCAASARPLFDGAGRPLGLAGVTQDVTERHEAVTRVRRSEGLLRTTTANTADTLLLVGIDLKVKFISRGFNGLAVEQILERDISVILPEAARIGVVQQLRGLRQIGEEAHFEFELCASSAPARYVESRAVRVRDPSIGTGISITLADITERKRLEKEILDVSSRERHSIGRDLHDGLGQELTGVALMLRGLATRLQRQAPDSIGYIDEVVALVNQSIETTRGLARGLLPVNTQNGGLPFALQELAARSRARHDFVVEFRAEVWPAITLSERDASHLYRIAQEALTNAARHGRASRADIFLLVTGSTFVLTISDDGVGLGAAPPSAAGMGIKIMKYRAHMVGAHFDITTASPRGTVVRISGEQPLPPITL